MSSPEAQDATDVVLAEIRRLQTAFDAKIRYDEARERVFDAMSEELTAHRQGLVQAQLRTVLLDLVAMHDDLTKLTGSPGRDPATVEALLFVRETVEQTLARNGVEAFTVEGSEVDRARQKVISVVETADPGLDRHVAERSRTGFSWHDKVLRPEWVKVYAAVQGAAPEPTTPEPADPTAETTPAAPLEDTRTSTEEGASS
ncbi:nucleotide exchange factor GrpE [Saccharothrix luteola]|uniref:nucleotide exchange factor GrpE n=1 Tax=Saccharothrix luteola TaxID=2893018 RepID=UPI001E4E1D3E|nr:nucleotide exchange factor GrpE [Saccharothrix luteola]MCC8245548.1 nucleotide exchange factor GrpE [Saccharothrix luteola]